MDFDKIKDFDISINLLETAVYYIILKELGVDNENIKNNLVKYPPCEHLLKI